MSGNQGLGYAEGQSDKDVRQMNGSNFWDQINYLRQGNQGDLRDRALVNLFIQPLEPQLLQQQQPSLYDRSNENNESVAHRESRRNSQSYENKGNSGYNENRRNSASYKSKANSGYNENRRIDNDKDNAFKYYPDGDYQSRNGQRQSRRETQSGITFASYNSYSPDSLNITCPSCGYNLGSIDSILEQLSKSADVKEQKQEQEREEWEWASRPSFQFSPRTRRQSQGQEQGSNGENQTQHQNRFSNYQMSEQPPLNSKLRANQNQNQSSLRNEYNTFTSIRPTTISTATETNELKASGREGEKWHENQIPGDSEYGRYKPPVAHRKFSEFSRLDNENLQPHDVKLLKFDNRKTRSNSNQTESKFLNDWSVQADRGQESKSSFLPPQHYFFSPNTSKIDASTSSPHKNFYSLPTDEEIRPTSAGERQIQMCSCCDHDEKRRMKLKMNSDQLQNHNSLNVSENSRRKHDFSHVTVVGPGQGQSINNVCDWQNVPKNGDENNGNGKQPLIQNSRTYLWDQHVVHNMRECWERFLQIQITEKDNIWKSDKTLRDREQCNFQLNPNYCSPQKSKKEEHKNRNKSLTGARSMTCHCEDTNKNQELEQGPEDCNEESKNFRQTISSFAKKAQSLRHQRRHSQCSRKSANCCSTSRSSSSKDLKRSFVDIKNEFEAAAVEFLKRQREKQQQIGENENRLISTAVLQPVEISSNEKVEQWIERNSKEDGLSVQEVPLKTAEKQKSGESSGRYSIIERAANFRTRCDSGSTICASYKGQGQGQECKGNDFLKLSTTSLEDRKYGTANEFVNADEDVDTPSPTSGSDEKKTNEDESPSTGNCVDTSSSNTQSQQSNSKSSSSSQGPPVPPLNELTSSGNPNSRGWTSWFS